MEEENTEETESEEEEPKKKHAFPEEHPYAPPEWLKDTEFPQLAPEVAEALGGIEQPQIPQVVPDRIYIKTLIRGVNAMKILKWLHDRNDAFYLQQIADGVGLSQPTAGLNLRKLEKAGLVYSKQYRNINKQLKYFCLINKEAVELVLKQWLWHVGFQLGRYIPYKKVRIKEIKEDSRFIEKCKYFGLSIDEGVDTVKKCPKIKVEYDRNITFLSRISQGYIPPEEELEEEAIEVEVPEEFTPP